MSYEHLVNAQIEAKLAPIRKQLSYGPLYTAAMPGESYPERLIAACHAMRRHKGQRKIVSEPGWFNADESIKLCEENDVLSDVTFDFSQTVIWPSYEFPEQSTLIDLPAGMNVKLFGLKLDGRRWDKKQGKGEQVNQICLLHHRAGWEFNRNTARCIEFDKLHLRNAGPKGLYIGGPGGPDITQVNWTRCVFHNCGITAEGANIASYTFSVDFTGRESDVCYTNRYSVPKYDDDSDRPQLTDMWGKRRALNWVDTPVWRKVLIDGKHTWGGGPDITFEHCNASMGHTGDGKNRRVFDLHGGHIHVDDLRVEGLCRVARFHHVPGKPNLQDNRFECKFKDVDVVNQKNDQGELINPDPYEFVTEVHNPCQPVTIEGGYYPNGRDSLPPESNDPEQGIVTWVKPRGPEGVIEWD